MNVYVFGNPDISNDSAALKISSRLHKDFPKINFIYQTNSTDVSFLESHPVILDVVSDIKNPAVFNDLNLLISPPRNTVHDFDIGFQLKYLKKIGAITGATIIGLPMYQSKNYSRIHSIFKKLVEQDIHGS